jgi:hypothetical protein
MAQQEALLVDKYENQIEYIANIWSSGVVLFGHLLLQKVLKKSFATVCTINVSHSFV